MAEQPNPYAAPAARVDDVVPARTPALRLLPEGRSVPAGHGWQWLASAWALFKRTPGVWIVIFILYFVVIMVCSIIPIAGFFAVYLLTPVLIGGIMLGCAALDRGEALEVGHLFAGFREKTGPLLQVGLLYLAGLIAILVVVGLMFGYGIFMAMMAGEPPQFELRSLLLVLLVSTALSIPLVMALWFASPLVVFHDMSPAQALRASFLGCLKNIVPFLLYGVILLGLAVLATIPALLGFLVLGPVAMASVYTGYRDIFTEPAPAA